MKRLLCVVCALALLALTAGPVLVQAAPADGDKPKAMEHLTSFFEGLAQINLIDPALMKKVIKAMNTHFNAVVQHLLEFQKDTDAEITGDDLLVDGEALEGLTDDEGEATDGDGVPPDAAG